MVEDSAAGGRARRFPAIRAWRHGHHCRYEPRLLRRAAAHQSPLLLYRRVYRHPGRRTAGHRPGFGHVVAAARDAFGHAGVRHHHDGRHLLRLHVRRLDDVDPRQHPRRGRLGRDLSRRPRHGQAGAARGIAALGSFAAGTFALIALMLVAPALARVAIAFGPPEYFSLMVLGLTVLSFLSQGSMAKSLLMAAIGIILGLIGIDQITAQPRLPFDRLGRLGGRGLVPIVMGLFGVAEILSNLERELTRDLIKARIGGLWPSLADWTAAKWAI